VRDLGPTHVNKLSQNSRFSNVTADPAGCTVALGGGFGRAAQHMWRRIRGRFRRTCATFLARTT
jgi:hypothetical protein